MEESITLKPCINTYFKTKHFFHTSKNSGTKSTSDNETNKRKREDNEEPIREAVVVYQSLTNNTHSQSTSHSPVCSSDTPKHH